MSGGAAGVAANFARQGRKVVAIGRNYRLHAEELKNPVPAEPFWFLKPPSAYVLPVKYILLPGEGSTRAPRACPDAPGRCALQLAGECPALRPPPPRTR
jgi:hypothetical protein